MITPNNAALTQADTISRSPICHSKSRDPFLITHRKDSPMTLLVVLFATWHHVVFSSRAFYGGTKGCRWVLCWFDCSDCNWGRCVVGILLSLMNPVLSAPRVSRRDPCWQNTMLFYQHMARCFQSYFHNFFWTLKLKTQQVLPTSVLFIYHIII